MPVDTEPDILDSTTAGGQAVRGGVLRMGGYVAGILLTLASAPLLIRHLGAGDFGRYSAVLAVIGIVTGLTEAGINTIALREQSVLRGEERRRTMSDLLGMRVVLSLLGVVAAVGFAAVAGYGPTLVLGTALAAAGMVLTLLQTFAATSLQAQMRFGLMTATDLLRQFVTALLIVVLVIAGAEMLPFFAAIVAAAAVSFVVTLYLTRGLIPLKPALAVSRWMPLMRDTITFSIAIALNSLYFRITLVIMSLVAVELQTGYFAISFRVIEVLAGVPGLLIGAAFPIIARTATSDRERFRYGTARLFELGALSGLLTTVVVLLGAPFAIEVLAGAEGEPAVEVLQIQSIAIGATFLHAATGFPLLGLKMYRETLIANLSSLVVAVALTLILAPDMGARGAAIAAVCAEVMLAIVQAWMLLRAPDAPRLPIATLAIGALCAGAAIAAGLLTPAHSVVQTAVGVAVYLGLLGVTRQFPGEARELVKR